MSTEDVRDLLRTHGFRSTPGRVELIELLRAAGRPLTPAQVLEQLPKRRFNRVSIYRALEALVEAGLVHRACHDGRTWAFETSDHCEGQRCHPHFTCTKCGSVACLTETVVPLVRGLPKGYVIERQKVHIDGICPGCSRAASGDGKRSSRGRKG